MKLFSAITTAIMVSAMQVTFMADSQAAQPKPAALSRSAKKQIEDALAGVKDFTDAAAVRAAVLSVINTPGNKSFSPQIVAFAVAYVGQKLSANPVAAASVIPSFVLAATQADSANTNEIVGQAVAAVPANLKAPVVPKLVDSVLASMPTPRAKAEALNAALEASSGDATVVRALDQIANRNNIKITRNEDQNGNQQAARYFVDNGSTLPEFTGDQGTSTLGTYSGATGSGGGGGGNPSNVGNTPSS